jgi:hypothetical protein
VQIQIQRPKQFSDRIAFLADGHNTTILSQDVGWKLRNREPSIKDSNHACRGTIVLLTTQHWDPYTFTKQELCSPMDTMSQDVCPIEGEEIFQKENLLLTIATMHVIHVHLLLPTGHNVSRRMSDCRRGKVPKREPSSQIMHAIQVHFYFVPPAGTLILSHLAVGYSTTFLQRSRP